MSTGVGELALFLRANYATLSTDLNAATRIASGAASQMQNAFTGASEHIVDSMKEIAGQVAAAFAVERLVEFGKASIELGDKLNKMSQSTGVTVESLSALRVQAQLSDVSLESLGTGMNKLARNAAEAAGGSKQQAAAFQAIGVAVKDANGNLLPMQTILEKVAGKFSDYRDSAAKTALVQELFGKSGAQLIPLLNELGEKGFGEATKAANEYNQVIGAEQAKQSEEFNDNLTRLSMSASGFANAVVKELLPGLTALSNDMAEAAKTNDGYAASAGAVSTAVKSVVLTFIAAKETVAGLVTVVLGLGDVLGAVGDVFNGFAKGVGNDLTAIGEAMRGNFGAARQALADAGTSLTDGWEKASVRIRAAWSAVQGGVGDAFENTKRSYNDLFGQFSNVSSGADTTAKHIRDLNAPIVAMAEASDKAARAQEQFANLFAKGAESIAKLRGELDPYSKSMQQYVADIVAANKAHDQEIAAANKTADATRLIAQADQQYIDRVNASKSALVARNQLLKEQFDQFAKLNDEMQIQAALVGVAPQYQSAVAEAYKAANDAIKKNVDLHGAAIEAGKTAKEVVESQLPGLIASKEALVDLNAAQKAAEDTARDWSNIWISAGDSVASAIANVVTKGGSLFKSLADIAKQVVNSIVQYFAKLAVINPILNSIFGGSIVAGGGSLLPTLANAAVGGGGSGLSASGLLGGAANFASTASGGTQFSIMQPSSWISAGKSMWTGFSSGMNTFWNGSGMTNTMAMQGGTYANLPYGTPAGGIGYGGYGSAAGQALGVAGAAYAGYSRYQNRYNTATGVAGGLTYAAGTYALGAGIASAAAGAGFAAGVSGAFAAVPVVGWIALAAMIVDKISGGKLFGTAGKAIGGESKLDITSAGASVDQWYTTKGQSPLFGGAYFKEHHTAADQQTMDAINAFFDQLQKAGDTFARQFGLSAATIASGTFETMFDKNGKQTGTTTTINGLSYKDETQQQFAERLAAESEILTLKQLGLDVTNYTKQFITDADSYAKAVEDIGTAMAYANQDIRKNKLDISGGQGLQGAYDLTMKYQDGSDGLTDTYQRLAQEAADIRDGVKLLTGQDTIASIEAFLRESEKVGESLGQTYQRLQQASQQYTQFIAQFAPQATYVDDFEASLSNLRKSEQDAIKQANDLAKAAGLEGANTEDLVKIHQSAAKQFADLVKQLQESAQSLAFNLGLSNTGTLDQVNAEIERLQGLAGNASSSVSSFGDAMQSASQKATDAINLLLGNLSPMNDQEKLQKALQAQMQGLVAPDAVLEIGRRLYASSSAYNQLFAQVQAIGDRTNKGGSSYSGSGSSSATFTGADQDRLNALLAERDQLQKVAQLQQYQTLAQQIAEIASAKGEDYMQVISDMGINLKDFEKGLGIANDDALKAYIDNIQKQTDSDGQNTQSIVDAIERLGDRLTGTRDAPASPHGIPGNGGVHTAGADGGGLAGRSGANGGRVLGDGDYEGIGHALYNALQLPSGNGRRAAPV